MNLKHNQTYTAKTRKQKDLLSGTGNDQWTSFPSLHSPIHFCHSPKPDSWNRLWRRWQSGTLCPHRLPGYRHWFIWKPHPASPPVLPGRKTARHFHSLGYFSNHTIGRSIRHHTDSRCYRAYLRKIPPFRTYQTLPHSRWTTLYQLPSLANAFWRASADLPEQICFTPAFHSFIARRHLQQFITPLWRKPGTHRWTSRHTEMPDKYRTIRETSLHFPLSDFSQTILVYQSALRTKISP